MFTSYIAHHFPPYHIEAAQTPVCVVSVFPPIINVAILCRGRLRFGHVPWCTLPAPQATAPRLACF